MAENENIRDQKSPPKKPKFTVWHLIAIALVVISIALTLSNWNNIMAPLENFSAILAPITVGLVMAYILNFFLRFFEYKLFNKIKKRSLNRALSMLFSYVLLLAIIAGFLFLIIPSVMDSMDDLQANGMSYINRLLASINSVLAKIPFIPKEGGNFLDLEKLLNYVLNILSTSGDWIFSNIASIAGSTITILKNILVGLFISIYVLLSKERLNAGCRRIFRALFSKKNEERLLGYFSRAHSKFGGYMIGKLIDSLMVMLVCMLLFTIFKIPYAILIAVIIGVTDIIPFFGPFLGAIPSALIIFIADPWKAVVFVLLILVVQQIDGNLIAPVILGDKTGLSSLGVIVAVTVMGGFLGIVGMLIGVPLFALVISILDDFIKHRLTAKGEATDLKTYYPADAFIRPQDEDVEQITLTQRFVRWVSAVEQEEKTHAFFGKINRGIRLFFLAIGRTFHRLFSIKPIPADRKGGMYATIIASGIHTHRHFWRTLVFSILTLGIYPLYLVEYISQATNLACAKDNKRTWGVFPFLLFSIITLGVFPLIWHCKLINRMNGFMQRRNAAPIVTKRFYLCWTLIALPILVGPLIAVARFLRAFNTMAERFNSEHTFPLSEEEIDAVVPISEEEHRARKSIIEQIITPEEEEPLRLDDEDYNAHTEEVTPEQTEA
ncbi:MAG: AI-2E family transporter [Ruminococcaceae bacterium]|nr:AI-2E family transporter [Oscillospiraceae bacterium]